MNIELTPEHKALQQEVREYMKTVMTPELLEEMKDDELKEGGGPEFRKQYARMGADGWIGLSWSKELGGREMSHLEQYIFTDEVVRSGFAYPFLTTESVTPVIAANANDEIREEVVGGVKQGKVVIAIGYSEPSAGTDLAALIQPEAGIDLPPFLEKQNALTASAFAGLKKLLNIQGTSALSPTAVV